MPEQKKKKYSKNENAESFLPQDGDVTGNDDITRINKRSCDMIWTKIYHQGPCSVPRCAKKKVIWPSDSPLADYDKSHKTTVDKYYAQRTIL